MTTLRRLESYVCGGWTPGTRDGQVLLDAATAQPVARIDATGLDFADLSIISADGKFRR